MGVFIGIATTKSVFATNSYRATQIRTVFHNLLSNQPFPAIKKFFRHFLTFSLSLHTFFISSKSDEDDNDDSRIARKIYNLTDILSTPSSGFYKYETQQQQPNEQFHYKPSSSSDEKPKTKERYYIYSHVKAEVDDVAEGVNHDGDKSRKIRSSALSDRKQVSRNISMVLENLLMSYENSQLPTHGEGLLLLLPH